MLMLVELWIHAGKLASILLLALFLLLLWATSRAYVATEWERVPDLLWKALEQRKWRERSLPFWADEVADLYPKPNSGTSPLSDGERLALMAWGLGEVTQRELVRSQAITRRSVDRLEAWVSIPQRGVEILLLGWWLKVLGERCALALTGWRRITAPFWRRLALEFARFGKIVAMPAALMAFFSNATVGTAFIPDAGLPWWIGFWAALGTFASFVSAVVKEIRGLLPLVGFKFPSRGMVVVYCISLASILVAIYSMHFWAPPMQSGVQRILGQVAWPSWGSAAVGFIVFAAFLSVGLFVQIRTVFDGRRSLKERNDAGLMVVGAAWLLLAMVVVLAPSPILPPSGQMRTTLLLVLALVCGVGVCLHMCIEKWLFRRRLALVVNRGMVVSTRFHWGVVAGSLGAIIGSMFLLGSDLVNLMPLPHALLVLMAAPLAFAVLVWQVCERKLWARKVDRAFSEVSATREALDE
ncbi:hypothetical protein [Serinicoccus hydrothermalis]|uniref:hypothetical protein n=1 Tax=Serinicoccus hydrothermalis TaxID=1758689 RepID=UPI000835A824|nr:hypothetical protein [Serinicoccus hydrothermalis]